MGRSQLGALSIRNSRIYSTPSNHFRLPRPVYPLSQVLQITERFYRRVLKSTFYFTRSATTGISVSAFPYPSRVPLKEVFAVLELCAGKPACTVRRGPGPSNGVWLLGSLPPRRIVMSHSVSPRRAMLPPNQGDRSPGFYFFPRPPVGSLS